MKHNYFIILLFLMISSFGFAQTNILCPEITTPIKIENPNNIPIVSDNGDGTITLTHTEQYITDIFANYVIYDFYQYFPSANPNGELFKYYTIAFQNKDLINDMKLNIPEGVFSSYSSYESTPISTEIIDFLDDEKFNLKKHCNESSESGSYCPDDELAVPQDFSLKIEFNYDSSKNVLLATSQDLTPCGNSFSIAFKGGTQDNTLQLWKSTPKVTSETTYDLPCHYIEENLYSIFDISCVNWNFGDIILHIDSDANTFLIERQNLAFSTDFIGFEEDALSITDIFFKNIKLITSKTNPFIEFTNIKRQSFHIEVFSVLGEKIINKIPYQKHTISLNTFQNGLYFIKLFDSKNNYKTFKYIK